ncbi:MAG: hypothetical protein J0652_04075 [Desulfobulbaceae bacterium]|nr:hypothetical protein [Desulfobulbaceae bacterium]
MQTQHAQDLFNKICRLPPEKVTEVEDFVDFLRHRSEDNTLISAVKKLSEKSFQQVWDNKDDAEYDNL